ncbi:MAG: propanediol utilization protein [Anaerolineae bacterium]|nr:propanediol utilization protein [Anaerolineae bacterium]
MRSASGRPLDELNMDNLLAGKLTTEDFRISGETLEQQARAAEDAGYKQLGENLRRAAELAHVSNERVFEIYDALRPGRATYAQLTALADELAAARAPRTAALVRKAAEAYLRRGLIRPE